MHTDFCPNCFAAIEETDRGDYACPDCGIIETDALLSVADLAAEARCLGESNQAMRDGVTAIVRMGHELPADVMAALAKMKCLHQPCSHCGVRLGTAVDGVGDTWCCPVCLPKAFPGFVVVGAA